MSQEAEKGQVLFNARALETISKTEYIRYKQYGIQLCAECALLSRESNDPKYSYQYFIDHLDEYLGVSKDSVEYQVVLSSILMPDTKELAMANYINMDLNSKLTAFEINAKMAGNYMNAVGIFKYAEYSRFRVKEMVARGELELVDSLVSVETLGEMNDLYKERPEYKLLSPAEYLKVKNRAIELSNKFAHLDFESKHNFINSVSLDRAHVYPHNGSEPALSELFEAYTSNRPISRLIPLECSSNNLIFLSTLFIPDDATFLQFGELVDWDFERMNQKYKVPAALIEYKKNEIDRQGTVAKINDGSIQHSEHSKEWFFSGLTIPELVQVGEQVHEMTAGVIHHKLEDLFTLPSRVKQTNK